KKNQLRFNRKIPAITAVKSKITSLEPITDNASINAIKPSVETRSVQSIILASYIKPLSDVNQNVIDRKTIKLMIITVIIDLFFIHDSYHKQYLRYNIVIIYRCEFTCQYCTDYNMFTSLF